MEIKRLKVTFIDKETMGKVEDVNHVLVRALQSGELMAVLYSEVGPKEVEIKIEDDGSVK